jgi:hypothetical protein
MIYPFEADALSFQVMSVNAIMLAATTSGSRFVDIAGRQPDNARL